MKTNYFTINGQITEYVSINNTIYFQPDLNNINDYRFLYDGELELNIKKNFKFSISVNFRYDNEPHSGTSKQYIVLNNGISFKF